MWYGEKQNKKPQLSNGYHVVWYKRPFCVLTPAHLSNFIFFIFYQFLIPVYFQLQEWAMRFYHFMPGQFDFFLKCPSWPCALSKCLFILCLCLIVFSLKMSLISLFVAALSHFFYLFPLPLDCLYSLRAKVTFILLFSKCSIVSSE